VFSLPCCLFSFIFSFAVGNPEATGQRCPSELRPRRSGCCGDRPGKGGKGGKGAAKVVPRSACPAWVYGILPALPPFFGAAAGGLFGEASLKMANGTALSSSPGFPSQQSTDDPAKN